LIELEIDSIQRLTSGWTAIETYYPAAASFIICLVVFCAGTAQAI
jgi:hypothetical protein